MYRTLILSLLVLLVFFSLLLPEVTEAESFVLRTYAQDSAPKYYRDADGRMQGICMDILRAVAEEDETISFVGTDEFMPFKRIQSRMEKGDVDVFFGFAKNESRMKTFRFLDAPLYEVHLKAAALVGERFQSVTMEQLHAELAGQRVLTLYATATAKLLEKKGFNVFDEVPSVRSLLQMLQLRRGKLVFYHDLGLYHGIRKYGPDMGIKVLPFSFRTYNHFVAFSKQCPEIAVRKVALALIKLERKGVLKEIRDRYFSL